MKDKPTNTTEGEELRSMNDEILLTTTNHYTKPAKTPCYLNGEQTNGPGTREGKTNHNTAKTRRKQNARVDDRRTSISTGKATEIANEARRTPRTTKLLIQPTTPRQQSNKCAANT